MEIGTRLSCVSSSSIPRALSFAAIAGALFATSCDGSGSESDPSQGAANPRWAYEKEFSQGPVSFVLRVDRVEGTLADEFVLEQELRAEPGYVVEFPEFLPEDFEGFSVIDITYPALSSPAMGIDGASETESGVSSPPRATPQRKRLTLEPEQSGELAIAPFAIYFHREEAAEENSFLTEPIAIRIETPEDPSALRLEPLRSIYPAPPAEPESRTWIWAVAAGVVVLAAAIAVFRRRRSPAAVKRASPHEVAYDALRRLVQLGLVEKGAIELFFVHLSSVLREFIESRFSVHAPERTTEEFLVEATRHPSLRDARDRLAEFLSLSDRVKFARFEPDEVAIQGAFNSVKEFLAETKDEADVA